MKYTTKAKKFNPYFVTGFCDAESCFTLNILKNPFYKTGWKIGLVFDIHLHSKDIDLLYQFQKFFGIGYVNLNEDSRKFRVTNLEDLVLIIEHFNLYPLKTQKYADFYYLKKLLIS